MTNMDCTVSMGFHFWIGKALAELAVGLTVSAAVVIILVIAAAISVWRSKP